MRAADHLALGHPFSFLVYIYFFYFIFCSVSHRSLVTRLTFEYRAAAAAAAAMNGRQSRIRARLRNLAESAESAPRDR